MLTAERLKWRNASAIPDRGEGEGALGLFSCQAQVPYRALRAYGQKRPILPSCAYRQGEYNSLSNQNITTALKLLDHLSISIDRALSLGKAELL